MRITRGIMMVGLGAMLVAGCSKAGPEPQPETFDNESEVAPAPIEQAPAPVEKAPKVVEPAANAVEALPAEPDPSREAQMLEDADATGLTARTSSPDVTSDPSADPIGDLVENGGVVSH